ncbi:helix-turn-helix domain-containing protein [Arthrobacter sp. HMWF013]|uniref:helix-turn-helix domain-containing protein n=1 Tax=Arthrobacter sp. HMWF013 TaxID=2056849 RepID=UPI002159E3CF|nr:helix-turn-helix transcriptional regulator [Arthrobacter sp. HMWF013]
MPSGKQPVPGPLAREFSTQMNMVMEREGITKAKRATATGLSRNYVSKRLRDEVPFTLNDVETICNVLGIQLPKLG